MNNIVRVGNHDVVEIKWKGQRVITTAQLAQVYETDTDNIKKNYQNNKERFKIGEHLYTLSGNELKEFKGLVTDFPQPFMESLRFTPQLYLWTRKGASRHCKMLGTEKAWEQFDNLEESYFNSLHSEIPQGEELLALAVLEAQKTIQQKNQELKEKDVRIQQMKPKEIFADAVATSHTSILIGDLAKLIKQNGVNMGQKRLFEWLRDNGYLIKQKGTDWNMPTQKSMEMELFEIKESTFNNPDGSVRINRTTKVTGKGQQYFINKFLDKEDKQ